MFSWIPSLLPSVRIMLQAGLEKMYISREAYRDFPWAESWKLPSLYDATKRNCFLENVALKSIPLPSHLSAGIDSHSTCEHLHRRRVQRYHSVHKNEILTECKRGGSGKSLPRSDKFSHRILACGNQEALIPANRKCSREIQFVLCGDS